jgi:hypothetical protein
VWRSVAGLNSTVITRNLGVASTDKSPGADNTAPGAAPPVGHILAVPPQLLATGAAGDPSAPQAFVGYAWSGAAATVDGAGVTGYAGVAAKGIGRHTLSVGGTSSAADITAAATPSTSFAAAPAGIAPGGSSTLSWALTSGTFVAAFIDQGVGEVAETGSRSVSPPTTKSYSLYQLAREGGTVTSVTVEVGGATSPTKGDANGDGTVSLADVFYLVAHLYRSGPSPVADSDVNGDGRLGPPDVFYLLGFLLAGGPAPA